MLDYYPVSDRGVFSNITYIKEKLRYDKVQTTFSNIPIKNKLTLSGSIVCWGGIYEYAYSVDEGKTWHKINTTLEMYTSSDFSRENDISNGDVTPTPTKYEHLLHKWITRSPSNDQNYFDKKYGKFNGANSKLVVDLSEYEGEVVDVIVAAKPYAMYVGGVDKFVKWESFDPNSEGVVLFAGNINMRYELGTEQYANLPAGDYKIYFLSDSASIYNPSSTTLGKAWTHYYITEPVSIKIVDDNSPNTIHSASFNNLVYGASGTVTLPQSVYYVGDIVTPTYSGDLKDKNGKDIWYAIVGPNGERYYSGNYNSNNYTYGAYITEPDRLNTSSWTPGQYQIIVFSDDSNLKDQRYTTLDFELLPASARSANMTVAGTSIGTVPYTHVNGDITLTVTEEDVVRGYVTVTVDFSDLSANTRFCLTMDNVVLTKQT